MAASALNEIENTQVYADPLVELALVEQIAAERGRPVRVLLVGSGGCTALTLLSSPLVERVDAVDLNPAQVRLVELRAAAVASLSLDEHLDFIGARETPSEANRVSTYKARVRPALARAAQEFWDDHTTSIETGLNREGRFDRMLQQVGTSLAAEGLDPIDRPSQALGHEAWQRTFASVFEPARLQEACGTSMTGYSKTRSFARHFSDALARGLRDFGRRGNYFLHAIFRQGMYDPASGAVPPYLEPERHAAAQKQIGRLHLHRGAFLGTMVALTERDGLFDVIQTSDLTDRLPLREAHELIRTAARCLSPGGALLARRMNADAALAPLLRAHLDIDSALSATLLSRERSCLYAEVVVGRTRPVPATLAAAS